MSWPGTLVLVRHAESEGNIRSADERAAFDTPTHEYALTERGREQARITGEWLRANGHHIFDVFYTSYYRRAQETMQVMFPGANVRVDPRLAEAQRGIWHTMTHDQIKARFPEEFVRREREDLYHYRPFGGENWPDVELRIHSFLGTMARDACRSERWLIVCHGHWLVLFQRLIHHFPIERAMDKYRSHIFGNASVTIYHRTQEEGKEPRLFLHRENIVPWEGML